MPPLKIKYSDSDPTTIYLRRWIQPLINENNRTIIKSSSSSSSSSSGNDNKRRKGGPIYIHLPKRDIINLKRQKKLHKRGIYNYIRICDFIKIEKYSIYGIVRDSQNLQLSCLQQKMC